MRSSILISFIGFACLWLSCEKWNLEKREFIQVEMFSPEALSIDSVRVFAEILDWQELAIIDDHGFIWNSAEEGIPSLFFNLGQVSLGVKTQEESPDFTTVINGLTPKTSFIFRAYVSANGLVYYSKAFEYQTGSGNVLTLGANYQAGFEITLEGQLEETEKGLFATKHGFCWSYTHSQPTLTNRFIDLGYRRSNDPYFFLLDSLINEQVLYFRAYAILQANFVLDTVYGEVMTFDGNLNFWTRRADFGGQPRSYAVGFAINGKGYIGTGASERGERDFWEYDPQTDVWTQRADFGGVSRWHAVGFSIENKGYIGTGYDGSGDVGDFWEYDPQINR